jgi:geranylgeranylglycerol-phosphate geranylgeranyltransferase
MFAYLEILRPLNGLIAVFAVFVAAMLVNFLIPYQLLLAFWVVFLISSGGMVINDYFDYEIDRINRPKRPIPSGRISRKNALIYAIALFLIANVIALFLNFYKFTLAFLNTIINIIYSWKLKKRTLIGNLFVSWLAASTFLFGSLLNETITVTILILFLIAFSSNVGREITKTIEDIKGDRNRGVKSLPLVAGKNFAGLIAMIFILFAIFFSPLPYMLNLLSINYLYIVILADIIFAFSCFLIFILPKKSQKLMKIAMFVAIIAFLTGIL